MDKAILRKSRQEGIALVYVLVILVIITIFSYALMTIASSQSRQTTYQEKNMKAYYIARSGAAATSAWLSNPTNNTDITMGSGTMNW